MGEDIKKLPPVSSEELRLANDLVPMVRIEFLTDKVNELVEIVNELKAKQEDI